MASTAGRMARGEDVTTARMWHTVDRRGKHTTFPVHLVQGTRRATYLLIPLLHKLRVQIAETVLVDHLGGISDWYFTSSARSGGGGIVLKHKPQHVTFGRVRSVFNSRADKRRGRNVCIQRSVKPFVHNTASMESMLSEVQGQVAALQSLSKDLAAAAASQEEEVVPRLGPYAKFFCIQEYVAPKYALRYVTTLERAIEPGQRDFHQAKVHVRTDMTRYVGLYGFHAGAGPTSATFPTMTKAQRSNLAAVATSIAQQLETTQGMFILDLVLDFVMRDNSRGKMVLMGASKIRWIQCEPLWHLPANMLPGGRPGYGHEHTERQATNGGGAASVVAGAATKWRGGLQHSVSSRRLQASPQPATSRGLRRRSSKPVVPPLRGMTKSPLPSSSSSSSSLAAAAVAATTRHPQPSAPPSLPPKTLAKSHTWAGALKQPGNSQHQRQHAGAKAAWQKNGAAQSERNARSLSKSLRPSKSEAGLHNWATTHVGPEQHSDDSSTGSDDDDDGTSDPLPDTFHSAHVVQRGVIRGATLHTKRGTNNHVPNDEAAAANLHMKRPCRSCEGLALSAIYRDNLNTLRGCQTSLLRLLELYHELHAEHEETLEENKRLHLKATEYSSALAALQVQHQQALAQPADEARRLRSKLNDEYRGRLRAESELEATQRKLRESATRIGELQAQLDAKASQKSKSVTRMWMKRAATGKPSSERPTDDRDGLGAEAQAVLTTAMSEFMPDVDFDDVDWTTDRAMERRMQELLINLQRTVTKLRGEVESAEEVQQLLFKYLCDTNTPGVEKPRRMAGGYSSLPRPSATNVKMVVHALASNNFDELRTGHTKNRLRSMSFLHGAASAASLTSEVQTAAAAAASGGGGGGGGGAAGGGAGGAAAGGGGAATVHTPASATPTTRPPRSRRQGSVKRAGGQPQRRHRRGSNTSNSSSRSGRAKQRANSLSHASMASSVTEGSVHSYKG